MSQDDKQRELLREALDALDDLTGMVSEAGQYMTAQSGMTAARLGDSRDRARAAADKIRAAMTQEKQT